MNVAFDGRPAAEAYTRAFRTLWQLPGFDPVLALRAEAGVILKTWAGRTKVAKPSQIEIRARLNALRRMGLTQGDVTINAGIRGQPGLVWHKTRLVTGGTARGRTKRGYAPVGRMHPTSHRFTALWRHFIDRDWRDINDAVLDAEAAINRDMKLAERSAGISRQSVIQIADDLGIDLGKVKGGGNLSAAAIAKARAAIASNGRAYKNGVGTSGGDAAKSFVDLLNRLPFGTKIGMDRTLAGVLSGRAKFIAKSYEKGAFDSLRKAAKAFPNLVNASALP